MKTEITGTIIYTANPNLALDITIKVLTNGKKVFIGTPINPTSEKLISGMVPVTAHYSRKVHTSYEILKNKALAQYEKLGIENESACISVKETQRTTAESLISMMYAEFPKDINSLSHLGWCLSTEEASKRDFEKQFAPRIADYINAGVEISEFILTKIIDDWYDVVSKSKHSNTQKSSNGDYASDTKNNLIQRINRCFAIYILLREKHPYLPVLYYENAQFLKIQSKKRELPKFIPMNVRRNIIQILKESADNDPIHVFAVCMLLMNCRIAEACAVHPNDITLYETYMTVKILKQAYGKGLSEKLKTSSSKRVIVGCKVFRTIVATCISKMNSMDSITISDSKPMLTRYDLYEYFISLIKKAGIEQAFIDDFKSDYVQYEYDEEDGLLGVASHIARRDFVNICMNYCGFSFDEAMVMIGHKSRIKKMKRLDMANPSTQEKVANKLENFVYDISCSNHSYYNELSVESGDDISFNGTVGINVSRDKILPVVARVYIESMEINDLIEMYTDIPEADINIQLFDNEKDYSKISRNIICSGLIKNII